MAAPSVHPLSNPIAMKLFDKKGIMIIPTPEKAQKPLKETVVIKQSFCPNGHNLVSRRVRFGDHDGILIGVKLGGVSGLLALSPVYGDKSRVSLDIDFAEGDILEMFCPDCHASLPSYSVCSCGGELIVMFTQPKADFMNCIGICNRVGCKHAEIKNEGQLMTLISNE